MDKQKSTPDLSSVLDNLKGDIFSNINCINIGIIDSFDATNQTATIRIALKRVVNIDENGTKTVTERPALVRCPVFVYSGGEGYISHAVSAGDECILLFNDREIDRWWTSGGIQTPQTQRAHDVADALAVVGVRSLQKTIADYLTDGIRMVYGAAKIDIKDDLIESLAENFIHTGNMEVTEDLEVGQDLLVNQDMQVLGVVSGNGSNVINVDSDIVQSAGRSISAGNGATGNFTSVTVVDGIVISGT